MPIPQEYDLSGRIAILTGYGQGWTSIFASVLAEAGADVAIAEIDEEELNQAARAVEKQGKRALPILSDVTKTSGVNAMVDKVVAQMGKVDILVNNAHVEFAQPFSETTLDEWQRVMDINVTSTFLCCQAVGKQMLKQGWGRIVNISSTMAQRSVSNMAAYCASQGAVFQLTGVLSLEWIRNNITVNAIGVGWISSGGDIPIEQDPLARFLPSRRRGRLEDLHGVLLYLSSDACSNVSGQTIFIDGGAMAHL